MKKEIRVVDQAKGIMQITCEDERFYTIPSINAVSGLPEYRFIPSVTWICSYYPKGIAFYRWLADQGWDESQAIKAAAGNRGSRIHRVTELLESGAEIGINQKIESRDSEPAELDAQEIKAVMSFIDWHTETKPKCLANELVVFGNGYAGTIDRIYLIDGKVWIIDLKTSKQVWEEMILQISAYSHAQVDYKALGITEEQWAGRGLAILQIGYHLNKKGYKFNEIEDKFKLFQMAQAIWSNENQKAFPKQIDVPLKLKLTKENQNGKI